jgi:outer membrane protein insertion porin family
MIFRKFILILTILFSFSAYGQVINNIVISGVERVEDETIKSYIDIVPGVSFTSEQLDSSLKKLYASNLFQRVNFTITGNTLNIKIIENPKINLVVFEGNSKVKTKDLEAEIALKPRSIYTKAKVQEDVNRIIDLYNKNGRFSAKVIPQIIALPQNRVDLIFKIEEGPMAKIEKIVFIGNKAFSTRDLLSEISSKETHWYLFLSSSDQFNPSRIEYDRELLTRFYQSKGYADFKIISVVTNVSEKKEKFYITYTIDEGIKYRFGEVKLESRLKAESINLNELKDSITTKTNAVYDIRKVEQSINNMIKQINDKGFAFVDIAPMITLDETKALVNITYNIGESRRVYINEINIKGNVRTADKVIRREFRLSEGDPYNSTKITRSEKSINNLDFFEPTNITTSRTEDADRVDLNIKVQEKSTASLTFAGGYSTGDGPIGKVGFNEANLFGNGQNLGVGFAKSNNRLEVDLGFTEPYMFGKPISGGFDLFSHETSGNSSQYRNYSQVTRGVALRSGYAITENLRHNVYYRLAFTDINNISDNASTWVKDQEGKNVSSLIGHGLTYDRRDSAITPTEGYIVSANQDYSGVGGDTYFIRHTGKFRYYYPVINDNVILVFATDAGNIIGLRDQNVKIGNKFFMGGSGSVRGFEFNGIGPRTKDTNEPVGGDTFYSGTLELKFPLGFGKELGIFGATFIDAGSLFSPDVPVDQQANIWDSKKVRSSYGAGVGFVTPMGPIRVNYAVPMSKTDFDKTQNFDIEFKTTF